MGEVAERQRGRRGQQKDMLHCPLRQQADSSPMLTHRGAFGERNPALQTKRYKLFTPFPQKALAFSVQLGYDSLVSTHAQRVLNRFRKKRGRQLPNLYSGGIHYDSQTHG